MRLISGIWLLLMLTTAVACQPEAPPPPPIIPTQAALITLRIGLTDSALPVADLVTPSFSEYNNQINLQFVPANDAALLADLQDGQLDAVLINNLPPESDFWFNPVAIDGLVLLVHPNNPLNDLSLDTTQAIFNGEINNWSQIGGVDESISLISREAGAGTREIFTQRVLSPSRLALNAEIVAGETAVQQTITADPFAIGYGMAGAADIAKLITLNTIAATPAELAAQHYPLSAPLYFVTKTEPQDELRTFLGWLQSEIGQGVLGERYGRIK